MFDYPASVSIFIKDAQTLVQILAVIIGGILAYIKFFMGRVLKPRLEPTISGKSCIKNKYIHVLISSTLNNVGLSKITLEQKGAGIRVLSGTTQESTIVMSPAWDHKASFPVFEEHKWIEPGETICEKRLVTLPEDNCMSVRLELNVYTRKVGWHAMDIIELAEAHDTPVAGEEIANVTPITTRSGDSR